MCRKLFFLTSFVLVLGLTATVAKADISDGIVAYWPLDEGTGTTTADRSGNGNDGTLNLPGWDIGKFSGALNFDGVDDYVDCGNPSILDFGTSDFTVSAWIKTTNAAGETIFANGGDNIGGIRVRLFVEGNPGVKILVDDNNTKYDPEGNIAVVDGHWHHIIGMRSGTALRVYIDGVEDQGATAHGESTIPAAYDLSGTSQHNAYIGVVTDNETSQLFKFFGGLIDDVALWNRALTVEEISYLWNDGAGNPVDVTPPGEASDPYPADGSLYEDTWVNLSWMPGESAVSHDVYFGENLDDVDAGTGGTFRGNQPSNDFLVGLPGCPYPDGLVAGTTYYWRIDEVEADGVTKHRGTVWSFFVPSSKAYNPVPPDGAESVAANVTLTWEAGIGAELHTVYFDDNPEVVANAVGGIPQMHTQYYPGALEFDRMYYWRVDEFDGAVTHKGDVWSFTTIPAAEPSAVSTFHCIGIYWSPAEGASDNPCEVRYRKDGTAEWKTGMNLWFDDRNREYRGSIVHLEPATTYEVELTLPLHRAEPTVTFTATTWDENFPIAETIELPRYSSTTLEINNSGTADGYILYTAPAGGAVIDVEHNRDYCITVNASYIIIRGLNLQGANKYGIRLYDCHDVVIERCDISDFSRIEDDGWGNRGAAIYSGSAKLKRIIVQRNKMHHPYSDTNSWSEYRAKYASYHPRGPRAIGYFRSAGNHVIRYNEIYSDGDHYFADPMSSGNNNFPNRDSDIYGNYIANCWDDGIEAEDDNCNVRIWGNFIEWTLVKVAVAPTTVGPVYIWRNVAGVGRRDDIQPWNDVVRGGFLKTGNGGGGKIYVFHNTILQPEPPVGVDYPLGCGRGLGHGGPMLNTMSRNNILHVHNPGSQSIHDRNHDPLGDYDYDLYNGNIIAYPGAERHGIKGVPIYDPTNGEGEFALDPSSPGYDAGMVIPNFNDDYNGAAPDIGTHETGSPPMEFGVDAYQ